MKADFYKPKKTSKNNRKRLVLYLLIAMTLVATYYLVFDRGSGYLRIRAMERKIDERNLENASFAQNNNRIREEIYRLRNDLGYIEKLAREKLGLAKKGEIVYKFTFAEE